MITLIAYHGDPAIKAQYLARVRAHAVADEIVKGIYWENGKGCAVGCTVHSGSHAAYETKLGIPIMLARLEDVIFEHLSASAAKGWPERFLMAIEPGAVLELVWPRFALRLLTDPENGMAVVAKGFPKTVEAIERVAALFERLISGDVPSRSEWEAARAMAEARAKAAWATLEARVVAETMVEAEAALASEWAAAAAMVEAARAALARTAVAGMEVGAVDIAPAAASATGTERVAWAMVAEAMVDMARTATVAAEWATGTARAAWAMAAAARTLPEARDASKSHWQRMSDWLITLLEEAPLEKESILALKCGALAREESMTS